MKNKILGLGFLTILITQSCTSSLPLVLDENIGRPLTISVISPPDSINVKGEIVLVKYTWNYNKSKFEKSQNAVGEIKYTFSSGKFGGGRHLYDWERKYALKEPEGYIQYNATSSTKSVHDNWNYVYGKGRLMFSVRCSYKDKDGNKHWGFVSNYLEIPVIFTQF